MLISPVSSPIVAGLARSCLPALLRSCATYAAQREACLPDAGPLGSTLFQGGCLEVGVAEPSNTQLLRYRTEFPESVFGHLAGLLHSRPFPTAVDMSCALPGAATPELACRGFRVAEAVPPGPGLQQPLQRLPAGCSDLVTCLPGPVGLPGSELLNEARRLMAKGGFLAVAWNDRDLSSPFVSELESLLEAVNPDYCRASKQHNPPAWTNALSDGGGLRVVSFTSHPHGLYMPRCSALQDLLRGLAFVRSHLAASSATRKFFLQEVRRLVSRHYGGDSLPFDLPLITKLYVLRRGSTTAGVDGPLSRHVSSSGLHTATNSEEEEDKEQHGLTAHVRRRS